MECSLFSNGSELETLLSVLNRLHNEILSRLDIVEKTQAEVATGIKTVTNAICCEGGYFAIASNHRHSRNEAFAPDTQAMSGNVFPSPALEPTSPVERVASPGSPRRKTSTKSFHNVGFQEFEDLVCEGPLTGSNLGALGAWAQRKLRICLRNPLFDMIIAVIIASNAVVIYIQTDYTAQNLTDDLPLELTSLLSTYTAIFTVEALLRIASGFKDFFCGNQWRWNLLDLVVVLFSLIDVVVTLIPRSGAEIQSSNQFRMLRALRLTRLIRLVRITRLVRFIRSLRTLVHQIYSTVKSLIWAIILLTLIIFLFGTVFTQAVTTLLMTSADEDVQAVAALDYSEPLHKYWGTLPRSMMTLYQTLSNGIAWSDVVEPLAQTGDGYVALFLLYLCFTQFAVLNVITGVFCQTAIDSAEHDQELASQAVLLNEEKFAAQLRNIFCEIDADHSGCLTIQEFKDHFNDPNLRAYFGALDVDTSDVWTLFKLINQDNDDTINVEEFISGIVRIRGKARAIDLARLSYEFKWMTTQLTKFATRTDTTLAFLRHAAACGANQSSHTDPSVDVPFFVKSGALVDGASQQEETGSEV